MTDLARKLAEHPRWEWRPGMAISDDSGPWFYAGVDEYYPHGVTYNHSDTHPLESDAVPDIEHPATKGWLMAMLRQHVDAHIGSVEMAPHSWFLSFDGEDAFAGATEGEALARALLAAWGDE